MTSEIAYVGLGANVGHARRNLRQAVQALAALPDAELRGVSSLYRTRPVGVVDQPDFLNAAAVLSVPASTDPETGALALLEALKGLELALGRQARGRWGPREIDLDLLLFGSHELRAERRDGRWLQVPHPEMHARLFVLVPMAELSPELRPPGWTETLARAAARQMDLEGADAVRLLANWRETDRNWEG